MFLSRGHRDIGVAFQSHPVDQALSRREAKDSALLLSDDADRLEPSEWPEVSQASSSVWREDSGLLSRPCRKRRPSFRDDGGVFCVFPSCGASVGFLTRYDEDLREPLVLAQGSPISSRVVRESWGLLLSHCRANRPHVGFCPENPCSSPMATGISVLHSRFTQGFRPRLEWKQIISLSSRVATGFSWSP